MVEPLFHIVVVDALIDCSNIVLSLSDCLTSNFKPVEPLLIEIPKNLPLNMGNDVVEIDVEPL